MFRAPAIIDALPVQRPRRRVPWRLLRWSVILLVWGLVVATAMVLWFARDLPRPEDALDAVRRPSLVLRDDTGALVATYGDVVGEALRLTDMPKYLPAAAVSVEDRRFWTHWGIDPWGMARAFSVDLLSGHLRQGGSTITQQVAKNLFLTNARTLGRKVQEVLLTLWLERHFTKAEILEIWLNRAFVIVAGGGACGAAAGAEPVQSAHRSEGGRGAGQGGAGGDGGGGRHYPGAGGRGRARDGVQAACDRRRLVRGLGGDAGGGGGAAGHRRGAAVHAGFAAAKHGGGAAARGAGRAGRAGECA
jgi:hypothetical protein